jgi:hypothetical protein
MLKSGQSTKLETQLEIGYSFNLQGHSHLSPVITTTSPLGCCMRVQVGVNHSKV